MDNIEKYLKSKKRLLLNVICTILVLYTLIGDFPDDNKLLALLIFPLCIIQFKDWLRWQK